MKAGNGSIQLPHASHTSQTCPPLLHPQADGKNNVLKHAPHAPGIVMGDSWDRPYTREQVRERLLMSMWALVAAVLRFFPLAPSLPTHLCRTLTHTHTYLPPQAAYPLPYLKDAKFWPTTSRVDNVYGDRHLVLRWPQAAAAAGGAEQEPQAAVA